MSAWATKPRFYTHTHTSHSLEAPEITYPNHLTQSADRAFPLEFLCLLEALRLPSRLYHLSQVIHAYESPSTVTLVTMILGLNVTFKNVPKY